MHSLAIEFDHHAIDVKFTDTELQIVLVDGRSISAPLEWFPRLRDATKEDRNEWRLIGRGIGIHWTKIDEDIAIKTLMH